MKRDQNPHHKTLNSEEEQGWEGTGGHMKTALLNWLPSPIPHAETFPLKTGGMMKSEHN